MEFWQWPTYVPLRWWRVQMSRDPDAKHGDINHCDDLSCDPFYSYHQLSILGDNENPVDNDLHQQLDFKNPTEQERK